MNLHLHMHLDILKKMERYVIKYISHILRYMNTFNIYMICHKKAKYDL